MHQISIQGLSQFPKLVTTEFSEKSNSQFPWKIKLYNSDGGFKKFWILGQDNCPIERINFELNEHICGAGNINFIFLDFPIFANDYIEIYYEDSLKYRAYIENTVDPKGGKIKLVSYAEKLKEILYTGSFTNKTISEIFQTIIQDKDENTLVTWNSNFINTGSTDTYTLNYSGYEYPRKIFDELVKKLNDRYWAIRPDNIFSVYTPDTEINYQFFQHDSPFCEEITVTKNYKDIKNTRFQVFKKQSGSGETARIGQVGYDAAGGDYPILSLEILTGKKEKKFNISEVITADATALAIAYAQLTALSIPETIKCKNIDITQYFPNIGEKIKIQDKTELVLRTIIDCDSIDYWQGAGTVSLDEDDYKEGDGSITFTNSVSSIDYWYDFRRHERWYYPQKLGFMIKSDYAGDYLECSVGRYLNGACGVSTCSVGTCSIGLSEVSDYLWETTYRINIFTGALWQWFDVDMSNDFRYFGIRFREAPPASTTVNLDKISLYLFHRNEYTANVVKAKFKIDAKGSECDLELNNYDIFANDEIFEIERQIEKLEAIQQQ